MDKLFRVKINWNVYYYFTSLKEAWLVVSALVKAKNRKPNDDGTMGDGITIDIVHHRVPEYLALDYETQGEYENDFSKWLEAQS